MHPFVENPQFPPIVFKGRTFSAEEIREAVTQLAETLRWQQEHNDSPFVHLYAENHIKTIIAWFAIMQAGCTCVMIDPDFKFLEMEHIRRDTPPTALIRFNEDTDPLDFSQDIMPYPAWDDREVVQKRGYSIVYTAGEDGYLKGALLSIDNILDNARVSAQVNGSGPCSKSLALLPFHHMFGLTVGIVAPLLSGSTIVVGDVRDIQRATTLINLIADNQVTHLYTVPIVLYVLSKEKGAAEKFKSIEVIVTGGYKLPAFIYDLYQKKMGITLREGYGLTEAAPICSWHYLDCEIKIASVGRWGRYCNMKVVDENDNDQSPGSPGEICVQGANVMEGYLNAPDLTAHTLRNGWLHTGDLGYLDEENYVFLTGLKKRMTHVGGRNIYPAELERMLGSHPNVNTVNLTWTESAMTGAKITAEIGLKRRSTVYESQYIQWAVQNIAAFKLPKQWNFL